MNESLKPLTVSRHDASELTGLPIRSLDDLIRRGELKATKVGKRVLIRFGDLEKLVLGHLENDRTQSS